MPAITEVNPREVRGQLLFRADVRGEAPHAALGDDFAAMSAWLAGFGLEHVTAVAVFCRNHDEGDDGHVLLAVTQQVRDGHGPVLNHASGGVATVYRVLDLGPDVEMPAWSEKYRPENYTWAP